jgi:hypothetical protein
VPAIYDAIHILPARIRTNEKIDRSGLFEAVHSIPLLFMKWRSLKVLEETIDGCAIGYSDGLGSIDVAGIIRPTTIGEHSGLDAKLNAEKIVAVVNVHSAMKDALESSEKALMQAIAVSESVPGCDTRRWVSALYQIRLALDRTKEIDALWKQKPTEAAIEA